MAPSSDTEHPLINATLCILRRLLQAHLQASQSWQGRQSSLRASRSLVPSCLDLGSKGRCQLTVANAPIRSSVRSWMQERQTPNAHVKTRQENHANRGLMIRTTSLDFVPRQALNHGKTTSVSPPWYPCTTRNTDSECVCVEEGGEGSGRVNLVHNSRKTRLSILAPPRRGTGFELHCTHAAEKPSIFFALSVSASSRLPCVSW